MKLIVTIFALLLCNTANAQWIFENTFESPKNIYNDRFIIDTINHPNNIWQIGEPQKTTFNSAHSYPNAIVTDTANTYPANDTSVFYFKVVSFNPPGLQGHWYELVGFSFNFRLDIDSGEIAKVEISTDSGTHWVNLVEEDTTYDILWGNGRPDLSRSSSGCKYFDVQVLSWGSKLKSYPHYITRDTTLVRFTFISDSTDTGKDGWMMDNFRTHNVTESIETITNNNLISLYPNPAWDYIYIKANYNYYAKPEVLIYNLQGQEVYATKELPQNGYLPVNLPSGMYTLIYSTGTEQAVKQLVIQK